jgi:hypothetical protein
MLIARVECYVSLRQTLGTSFAIYRAACVHSTRSQPTGDTHIRAANAVEWATMAPSLNARYS